MEISTDKARLDITLIHQFLSEKSTWAINIPRALVETSIQHSLCFGGYENGQQIAFARVVSDHATFAYLMDVFILPEHQGRGLSRQLIQNIMDHPQLQGLRRFMLASSNARGLYQKWGFQALGKPEIMMEINHPDVYKNSN
jgi:N-acetylglutamate synthase-like GNAT family acetyltransferase